MPTGGPEPVTDKASEIDNVHVFIAIKITQGIVVFIGNVRQPRQREDFKLFQVYNYLIFL